MRKAQVTFDVTESKTVVTVIGTDQLADKIDITGTDIEKKFISLLKKLQKHRLANEIIEAIDINKFEQI